MASVRIGTVDIPERIERERYFQQLDYLELSALFLGPLKAGARARWKSLAPAGALGLVAPWVLTHRSAPGSSASWRFDDSVGNFRDSAHGRSALAALHEMATAVSAGCAVFRSPPLFSPSAAHRDQLRRFFTELATEEAVGAPRVWIPDGLWEPRAAVGFAAELGVVCAVDPLVRDPGQPAELYEDLQAPALYFRVSGLGRSGPISTEKLEDLAALAEHYQDIALTVAFASSTRWQDARNFKKLLGGTSDDDHPEDADDENDGNGADDQRDDQEQNR
jgi:uncharacterized protein YecE (DUF72 family)